MEIPDVINIKTFTAPIDSQIDIVIGELSADRLSDRLLYKSNFFAFFFDVLAAQTVSPTLYWL